ncbi:DEAD DEAH box helicase [Aspergillus sp. HF37]|nr:DEAD DEAH box helicase [Aspergillus sp. HF37]
MAGSTTRRASDIAGQKRKRTIQEDGDGSQAALNGQSASATAESTLQEPAKGQRRGRKPKPSTQISSNEPKKDPPRRKPSSTTWPGPLKSVSQIHRALNLVYTFCCARKHFATTFDNIKKAVQAQMGGNELTVEDVARVKCLVPRSVRFAYVDEAKLEVMAAVEDREMSDYGLDRTRRHLLDPEGGLSSAENVLLFEFVDGDLKKEAQRRSKAGKEEDLKMPVYSQKQMLGLIEKRNAKFAEAVEEFLRRCEDDDVDPLEQLEREMAAFVPAPPLHRGRCTPEEIPEQRKSVSEIIAEIREMDWYSGQIVPDGHRVFDAQSPGYGDLSFRLSQGLVNALYNSRGITQLYAHQAEAINHLHEGRNVIVSTSTSSGKSLIYQVPMLHELEWDPASRGMYIFPTKALAQDQRRSMKDLLHYMDGLEDTVVETFDGDTPMENRNMIRDEARILFTNPDMLHITILPQESSWRTFLRNLKFVVVDELHAYNGLFGSHVAFIMRRLRRVCAAVGNLHVKFISCSATVSNPEEHMRAIFGIDDVKLVDFDGSPSGRKEFVCWNTPFKDPSDPSSGRGDSIPEAARLFCQLILKGVRVIAFCRVRRLCEVLLQAVRDEFHNLDRIEAGKLVMGYRGGYSAQDRRMIEREMFEGKLKGIVATNALELGVDIGSLDAVVTLGFPYSISNLRQQSGRAGRRNKDSLSILVGDKYPTDQYYMRNPDELFTKPNCALQVDLFNELILEGHIQCAAFEMPLRLADDGIYFGQPLADLAATRLIKDSLGFYHCHPRFRPQPSRSVSIRSTEEHHFAIIDTTNARNIVLEEIEASRALFTVYEGGIFLHQGRTYLVNELNPTHHFARVARVHVNWNTMQRDITDIDAIRTEAMHEITPSTRAFHGTIQIRSVVYGFFKVDKRGRILDAVEVDNPPITLHTKGMWLDVPTAALDILASHRLNTAAAIHAAEHAVLSLLPSFIISSPDDVRTECKVAKKELGSHNSAGRNANLLRPPPARQRPARLTFYDAKGGSPGSGMAGKAFEFADVLLRRAVDRIESCECVTAQGCVECVCDERCKEANVVMSKAGAGVVLRSLLGWEIDVQRLPFGEDSDGLVEGGELVGGLETVVPAVEVPWR